MRWVLRIKNYRGLEKKGLFEEEGEGGYKTMWTMGLCTLWKKGHFIFTLTFWLKAFPVKNTKILIYSYYGIEWQMQHKSNGFFPSKYVF